MIGRRVGEVQGDRKGRDGKGREGGGGVRGKGRVGGGREGGREGESPKAWPPHTCT